MKQSRQKFVSLSIHLQRDIIIDMEIVRKSQKQKNPRNETNSKSALIAEKLPL